MVQIDLTITMGDTSKRMSLDEGMELYQELGRLFGDKQQVAPQVIKAEYNEKDAYTDLNEKTERKVELDTETFDVTKDSESLLNPVVEEAKRVARARTSGCGGSK